MRGEHRLRLFENRVHEVRGDWRKLHSEELHDLYSPPNVIR
jgi:hypothetical protein